jgi:sentrin-specific protease 1
MDQQPAGVVFNNCFNNCTGLTVISAPGGVLHVHIPGKSGEAVITSSQAGNENDDKKGDKGSAPADHQNNDNGLDEAAGGSDQPVDESSSFEFNPVITSTPIVKSAGMGKMHRSAFSHHNSTIGSNQMSPVPAASPGDSEPDVRNTLSTGFVLQSDVNGFSPIFKKSEKNKNPLIRQAKNWFALDAWRNKKKKSHVAILGKKRRIGKETKAERKRKKKQAEYEVLMMKDCMTPDSPDADQNEPSVSINIPESTAKFRKENERANGEIPDGVKQMEKLELSDHHTNMTQDARSHVGQVQDNSSSIKPAFKSMRFNHIPPAASKSCATASPASKGKDHVYEEKGDEQTYVLEPDTEVINELISDKSIRDQRDNTVEICKFDIPITRKDLQTLKGLNWLNDEVINFYFQMIMSRSQSEDDLPSVYVFSSFFYTRLTSAKSYNLLRRWTGDVDIFSHDFILIPVHLGNHWALCSVNCGEKCLSYYDSMAGGQVNQNGQKLMKRILSYLKKEYEDKKHEPLPSYWTVKPVGITPDVIRCHSIPQQDNGSDCGVFVCMYADCISRQVPFRFSQVRHPSLSLTSMK